MHIVNNKKKDYISISISTFFNSVQLSFIRRVPLYCFKSGTCIGGKMDLRNFAHGRICRKNVQDEE